jgi:peptide/nickel transport system substrate-binding protein
MYKNKYLNFILTVGVIAIIFFGIVIVKSLDHNRYQMEMVFAKLYKIDSALAQMKKKVYELSSVKVENHMLHTTHKKQNENFANKEFYDPNAVDGGHMIIPIVSVSKNMNSIINHEAFVSRLWGLTTCSLAARNYEKPEVFQPKLAESWELSDDKMIYTVNLRKGIMWHDFKDPVTGKVWQNVEVTADDFKFYVDVVKNKDVDCAPLRTYFKDLEKIEILSRYKFKVYWNKKYILSEPITLGLIPLPRHLYHAYDETFDGKKFNDDFQRNKIIVGCGPYRFVQWDAGQRIFLSKNDAYFGNKYGAAPSISEIIFEIIKHPSTQYQALLSDDIDQMTLTADQWVNRTDIPEFDPKSPEFKIRKFKYLSRSYSYIGYNLKNPLFEDKEVRQALTHLVDREKILKIVFNGLGHITTGNFFIDSPYYDKNVKPYPFSIKEAVKLLKKAGWTDTDGDGILDKNGEKFEFTVLTISNSTIQEKMFPIIKEDMKKAGIIMNINKVEWSVYVQRLEKKDFDVVSLLWALPFESDPTQVWHSSMADVAGSSNHIGFKNKKADELIEKIRTCFDFKERVKLCHEFHRLLHKEQPYTFLFSSDALVAINKKYRNVRLFKEIATIPEEIMWLPE